MNNHVVSTRHFGTSHICEIRWRYFVLWNYCIINVKNSPYIPFLSPDEFTEVEALPSKVDGVIFRFEIKRFLSCFAIARATKVVMNVTITLLNLKS